jgi:hypothetical protein
MFLLLAAAVTLAWDPVPDATSYKLYIGIQSIKAGNFPITSYPTDADVTQWTVGGLDYGTTYYFAATSLIGALESDYSNEVTYLATPPPPETSTIWPLVTLPQNPDVGADKRVTLGVQFTTDVPGLVKGIRFYKSAANTGTHTAILWDSVGSQLASATFSNETESGWQEVTFPVPVVITSGQTYTASYRCRNGHFASDPDYFPNAAANNGPLHAIDSVFSYGSSQTFPTENFRNTNYWVDVLFSP